MIKNLYINYHKDLKIKLDKNLDTIYLKGNLLAFKYRPKQVISFSAETNQDKINEKLIRHLLSIGVNRIVVNIENIQTLNYLLLKPFKDVALDFTYDVNNLSLKSINKHLKYILRFRPNSFSLYFKGNDKKQKYLQYLDIVAKKSNYLRFNLYGFAKNHLKVPKQIKNISNGKFWKGYGRGAVSFTKENSFSEKELMENYLILALGWYEGLSLKNKKHLRVYNYYNDKINQEIKNKNLIKTVSHIFINPSRWAKQDLVIAFILSY